MVYKEKAMGAVEKCLGGTEDSFQTEDNGKTRCIVLQEILLKLMLLGMEVHEAFFCRGSLK